LRNIVGAFNTDEEVVIGDIECVKNKLKQIREAGPRNLTVFTDFDFTLSMHTVNGIIGDSSFGIIQSGMSEEGKKKSNDLYYQYRPIEKDSMLSTEEKKKHMIEWWSQIMEIIVKERISEADIKASLNSANFYLRNGFNELFGFCYEQDIPAVIVSAGIAEVIKCTIDHAFHLGEPISSKQFLDTFDICSNKAVLDQELRIIKFKAPLINSLNKSEVINKIFYPNTKKNLIVMGDILEDIDMISNVEAECVLKIGFLNDTQNDNHLIKVYKEHFDIVILNDGNLHHVTNILRKISGLEYEDNYHKCKPFSSISKLFDA